MLTITADMTVFHETSPVPMYWGVKFLSLHLWEAGLNPRTPNTVYLFFNRARDQMRVMHLDAEGHSHLYTMKRDYGTFPPPEALNNVTTATLNDLINGVSQ